jgi:hypothetical protein
MIIIGDSEEEMGRACSAHGQRRRAGWMILMRKGQAEVPLGRPSLRFRWIVILKCM